MDKRKRRPLQHSYHSDTGTNPFLTRANICDRDNVSNTSDKLIKLAFIDQPPLEVRTSSKSDLRTFSCSCRVNVNPNFCPFKAKNEVENEKEKEFMLSVSLIYADDKNAVVGNSGLGGVTTKRVAMMARDCSSTSGQLLGDEDVGMETCLVKFNDLCVSVASLKHDEREFCLLAELKSSENGSCLATAYSREFYSYTHKSVLLRRHNVNIVVVSDSDGNSTFSGKRRMHIIGQPFIKSTRLAVVFKLPANIQMESSSKNKLIKNKSNDIEDQIKMQLQQDEDGWIFVKANNVEHYSDTVLFFDAPEFEVDSDDMRLNLEEVNGYVQVTNDGRNFSNTLPFCLKLTGTTNNRQQQFELDSCLSQLSWDMELADISDIDEETRVCQTILTSTTNPELYFTTDTLQKSSKRPKIISRI